MPATKRTTPSAQRRLSAQKRSRKKVVSKRAVAKPNWSELLKRKYVESERHKATDEALPTGSSKKKKVGNTTKHVPWKAVLAKQKAGERSKKRTRPDDDEDDVFDDDIGEGYTEGFEVQDEIDEEKEKRMNERQPLETQLFFKGLPLDAQEGQISAFASRFGKVRRVFMVRHNITKDPTGSCFIHFEKPEGASACLQHAQVAARELMAAERQQQKEETEGLSHHKAKTVQHKMKQIKVINRDPFVTFGTTRVTVHPALSRTQTQDLIGSMHKGTKKKRTPTGQDDPRNLYLLHEGRIEPETQAAEGLHPKFLDMLQREYEERRQQLRNVNYYVSKTRLSFRNVPKNLDEKQLRQLCSDQIRSYLKLHKDEVDKSKWGKFGPIKQLRIIKDKTGTSRGFAFAEFAQHNIALHTLRMLNNNPNIFGKHHRMIVNFAVEDANAIQKMARKRELFALRRQQSKKPSGFFDSSEEGNPSTNE